MWDMNMDVEAFKKRFFNTWFGPAAEDMLAYYNSYDAHFINLKKQNGYWPYSPSQSEYPMELLGEWWENIDYALNSIES